MSVCSRLEKYVGNCSEGPPKKNDQKVGFSEFEADYRWDSGDKLRKGEGNGNSLFLISYLGDNNKKILSLDFWFDLFLAYS